MALKYGKFELPVKIKRDESTATATFARFIAEPFERGFGHTVGNVLRRVMLTSLEAPAIISFMMEGVHHEYSAVEGIIEDVTHIILNLKGALLRYLPTEEDNSSREHKIVTKDLDVTQDMLDQNNGYYVVTLRDMMGPSCFELHNPDLAIFTATKPFKKRISFRIGIGRGYVPSERHVNFDKVVDEILIDSCFTPVLVVNYFVENTRVGQDTDYDSLVLEITTDGRVTPQEALSFAAQIGIEHLSVFNNLKTQTIVFEELIDEGNKDREDILSKLSLKISEIELSVRSTNCLSTADIDTIGELVVMPEIEMLKFRNFGKKSLTEIRQKLDEMGLMLGMDLSKYGINRDNIKSIINKYLEDKAGIES